MKTAEIIFPNTKAFDVVRDMIKHNELFTHCKVQAFEKTYPNSPSDEKITMKVEGRDKDLHAIQAMAWLTHRVSGFIR